MCPVGGVRVTFRPWLSPWAVPTTKPGFAWAAPALIQKAVDLGGNPPTPRTLARDLPSLCLDVLVCKLVVVSTGLCT